MESGELSYWQIYVGIHKMKLNLGCGNDIRNGYVNIDKMPQGQRPQDLYRQGDIQSLDWLVESETVEEIVVIDCIEYLPQNSIGHTIQNWAQKLSSGGILKILVPDCHAIAKSFYQGHFNLEEYSQTIFGTQNNGDNRMSVIDAATLISMLKEAGLTISLKRYEGVAIYVEATK